MCFGTFFAFSMVENSIAMKQIIVTTALSFGLLASVAAQEKVWTMDDCMRYAVENSPKVKQQVYTNNTYKAEQHESVASFLPWVTGSTSAQYNFGRAIDPNTNTYTNTSTFNNGYNLNAGLTIFSGGTLINQWRLANVNINKGKNDLQKQKDDLSINVMAAYVDVIYCDGMVKMLTEKLDESQRTLYKTKRQEELGLKGKADVAQIESQVAGDDYNLTHQQNLYNTAVMTLKSSMNYPVDSVLPIDTLTGDMAYLFTEESVCDIYDYASNNNPTALQASFEYKARKMDYLIMKGRLLPTISFNAGIYTSYFENLKSNNAVASFGDQFKNNQGKGVSFSLNFPLFDGLSRVTNVRRARNNMRIAQEKQVETLRQLQTDIEQAVLDREGYAKEAVKMEKKVEADEIAYQVTFRKFEEGLMSPIDLQTSANVLLESKAGLLQKKIWYVIKSKLVDYYKGQPLVTIEN